MKVYVRYQILESFVQELCNCCIPCIPVRPVQQENRLIALSTPCMGSRGYPTGGQQADCDLRPSFAPLVREKSERILTFLESTLSVRKGKCQSI